MSSRWTMTKIEPTARCIIGPDGDETTTLGRGDRAGWLSEASDPAMRRCSQTAAARKNSSPHQQRYGAKMPTGLLPGVGLKPQHARPKTCTERSYHPVRFSGCTSGTTPVPALNIVQFGCATESRPPPFKLKPQAGTARENARVILMQMTNNCDQLWQRAARPPAQGCNGIAAD